MAGLSIWKASQLTAWLPSLGIFNRSKKKFKAHTVYFVVLEWIKIKFLVQAAEFKFWVQEPLQVILQSLLQAGNQRFFFNSKPMAKLMVQRLGKQLYRQFPSLWGPTQLGFSSHGQAKHWWSAQWPYNGCNLRLCLCARAAHVVVGTRPRQQN